MHRPFRTEQDAKDNVIGMVLVPYGMHRPFRTEQDAKDKAILKDNAIKPSSMQPMKRKSLILKEIISFSPILTPNTPRESRGRRTDQWDFNQRS